MNLKVIACEVLRREIEHCAARSPSTIDVAFLKQGLHNNPDECRRDLQTEIDRVPPEKFDAALLGYGLCNNSLVGVRAGRLPLIIPRAHDCITLFLGSKERYARLFAERPGTYYYTAGWLEYDRREGEAVPYTQKSGLAKRAAYEELAEKYGAENAAFLIETMSAWEMHYTHAAHIRLPLTDPPGLEEEVRKICAEKNWEYCELPGDLSLIQDGLDGRWDADRFLVVPPGQAVKARYDDSVIACAAP